MVVRRTTADMFVEGVEVAQSSAAPSHALPPASSRRDFKSIRVPFNEREFLILERLAAKTGRSKLNLIRWAVAQLAAQEQVLDQEGDSSTQGG